MRHLIRLTLLMILFSCSNKADDFVLSIEIQYPFHPWDKFTIIKKGDAANFEYTRLLTELDSIYQITSDKEYTYEKTIKRRNKDTFIIKTLKTDSLIYFDTSDWEFTKDTVKNLTILNIKDKTKWTVVDSAIVSEAIQKTKKNLTDNDIKIILNSIATIKSKYESNSDPYLDGTTTVLKQEQNGLTFEFKKTCDYTDIRELKELIEFCNSIRNRDKD